MNTTLIIAAAGDGTRWNGYLSRRKHGILMDRESLLERLVRQAKERGIERIIITHPPGVSHLHLRSTEGVRLVERPAGLTNVEAHIAHAGMWNTHGPTIVVWGDSYLTTDSADSIFYPKDTLEDFSWCQFARLRPSEMTGKPGPEIFARVFSSVAHDEYLNALDTVRTVQDAGDVCHSSWSVYSVMCGKSPAIPPSEIRDWGRHIEIPDDGTDDFDFGDDYERWMSKVLNRSARRVTADEFRQPWLHERREELGLFPKMHRKLWEHSAIAQAYRDRIGSGGYALGFGVGKERLPAWLAAQGAQVIATDRPEPGVWLTRQHARGMNDMVYEGVCEKDVFERGVTYQPMDMRDLPELPPGTSFDFTWSSSCFEHLGSIRAGLDFFCNQMKFLRHGGIAVHTTEYDFSTNDKPLETPELSLFRQKDLAELEARLLAQGDRLWPINLAPGTTAIDEYIDHEPFQTEPHINLSLGGHNFTSVLLIAARGMGRR